MALQHDRHNSAGHAVRQNKALFLRRWISEKNNIKSNWDL